MWGRRRTGSGKKTRLKQRNYESALSRSRVGAPSAQTVSTIGPTIQHPEPTGATTDGSVPADKRRAARHEARRPCTTAWCDQISTPAENQLRFLFGTHLCP